MKSYCEMKLKYLILREKNSVKKLSKVILFTLFVFFYNSCDPVDHRELLVLNNTKGDVYWLFSENDTFKKPHLRDDLDSIEINKNGIIRSYSPTWDERISRSMNHKLALFIVKKDTVEKYGWEKTFIMQKYYIKIQIDMDYLEKNDLQIEIK